MCAMKAKQCAAQVRYPDGLYGFFNLQDCRKNRHNCRQMSEFFIRFTFTFLFVCNKILIGDNFFKMFVSYFISREIRKYSTLLYLFYSIFLSWLLFYDRESKHRKKSAVASRRQCFFLCPQALKRVLHVVITNRNMKNSRIQIDNLLHW